MKTWRRDFHAHPELGFHERRTAEKIAQILQNLGAEVHRNVGNTGVVAVLQRGNGTRSIGLRADMDALPISETNDFAYRSTHKGVMHACGHDGHTAMLLGAATALAETDGLNGRVVFIFQPNEEHGHGARAMIDDGLFTRFDVDDVYGMHNIPGMARGTFATRIGPIAASESLFEIHIKTDGGHAALPHMGGDAIAVGASLVGALQTIVSRKLNPSLNGVVSVTEFQGDGRRNVLAGNVTLKGDARALSPDVNAAIEARMREITAGTCAAYGASAEVDYSTVFPATLNSAVPTEAAIAAATDLVGAENVQGACEAKLFSDDFAHMAAARPGCYILMGNGTEGANGRPLHSSDYDFSDEALIHGCDFWTRLVARELA